MSHSKLLTQVTGAIMVVLLLVGCGGSATPTPTPTSTPLPTSTPMPTSTSTPTLTPTVTPTPTPTPIPLPEVTGTLIGRTLGERPGDDSGIVFTFRGKEEDEEVDYTGDEPLSGMQVVLCQLTSETICTVQPHLTATTDEEGAFRITDVEPGRYAILYNGSGETRTEWEGLEIDFTVEEGKNVFHSVFRSLDIDKLSACALYASGLFSLQFSGYIYSNDLDLAFVLLADKPLSVSVQESISVRLSVWSTREGECEIPNTLSLEGDEVGVEH